jgi:hypothetical protein
MYIASTRVPIVLLSINSEAYYNIFTKIVQLLTNINELLPPK